MAEKAIRLGGESTATAITQAVQELYPEHKFTEAEFARKDNAAEIAVASGRLPVSLPRSTGQVPVYYNYKNSYRAMTYMDEEAGPLFPFGYGLGYGTFEWGAYSLSTERCNVAALENKGLTIRFSVKNTSERGGYIVPQIYVTDVAASTVRRVKELKAFQKVWLDAGQERTVSLQLGKEAFCLWNQKMKYVAEPGVFRIELSDSAQTIWKGEFTLCI